MQLTRTLLGLLRPFLLGFRVARPLNWVFMLLSLVLMASCSSNEPRDFEPADFAGFQPKTMSVQEFEDLVGDFLATAESEAGVEEPDLKKIRVGAEMIEAALLKADSLALARSRSKALRIEVILLAAEFPEGLEDNLQNIANRLGQFIEHIGAVSKKQQKTGTGTSS